jgi:hypothetical protein
LTAQRTRGVVSFGSRKYPQDIGNLHGSGAPVP